MMRSAIVQKFFITGAIFFLTAGFCAWGLWWLFTRIESDHASLGMIESSIAFLRNERGEAQNASLIMKTREHDIERLNRFAVDAEWPVEFVEHMEHVAEMTKNTITLDVDETKKVRGELMFRVVVDGNMKSVFRYLKLVELMPYDIAIHEAILQQISSVSALKVSSDTRPAPLITPTARLTLLIRVKTTQ